MHTRYTQSRVSLAIKNVDMKHTAIIGVSVMLMSAVSHPVPIFVF